MLPFFLLFACFLHRYADPLHHADSSLALALNYFEATIGSLPPNPVFSVRIGFTNKYSVNYRHPEMALGIGSDGSLWTESIPVPMGGPGMCLYSVLCVCIFPCVIVFCVLTYRGRR